MEQSYPLEDNSTQLIKYMLPFLEQYISLMFSQSSIQTAHSCLPFVLRDKCDNFFLSPEAAVPDAMGVAMDLPLQALLFLLLVPETFESSDDSFSLRGLLLRRLIGSHPFLGLSLLELLVVEDIKLSAL
jgi:hypothetical protein